MGAVSVKYKARRGPHEAGTEVEDPVDYFEHILEDQFDNLQPMYDSLDDGKKQEFQAIFDDNNIMSNKNAFQMWLNECDGDLEILGEAQDKLRSFMSANQ